jgi:hypothetical protein
MSVKLNSSSGGSVTLQEPVTASNFTLTLPASTATVATTTGTLTNPTINGFTGDTSVINVGSGQFYKDASGNVGIGGTPANGMLELFKTSGEAVLRINNTGGSSWVTFNPSGAAYLHNITNTPMVFTTNGTERARIYASGNFGITNNLDFVGGAGTVRIHLAGGTPTSSNSGIAAAWNLHSDYRLKENVTPLTDALQKVLALKPVTFSWIGEEAQTATAGFLAHELAGQAPYAVMGEKDAVNDEGGIIAQSADYSKVVPLLVAAIQELKADLDAANAEIATLKGAA